MATQSSLEQMFKPNSVAVIGATSTPGEPGCVIMENLMAGTFLGPVLPVNETGEAVAGMPGHTAIDTLPLTPDLAIICSPPETIPGYIEELGKRGTRAAVIMSRGFFRFDRERREVQKAALLQAAQRWGVRVLGPNCLGFITPSVGVNASLAPREALPGKVAFLSQSDSLFTSVLDWATSKGIGFSHFIALGDRYDVHFNDVLDYLNGDVNTRAVLLYIETIDSARRFMSAARALARNKPVLVIKAGRSEAAAAAAAAHSGMLLGADEVYDAAFRRAGMLRVADIDAMFDTVETLALAKPLKGDRLAILTNGGSPGFLATDALLQGRGKLAELSDETCQALDNELGRDWSYWNPLIVRSSADGAMYAKALQILLDDRGVDAVLVMHVPTFSMPSDDVAGAVIEVARRSRKPVLTSWLGIDDAAGARRKFAAAGVPSHFTPDNAVRAFLNMVEYRRNQDTLMETPPSLPEAFNPDVTAARMVVNDALEAKRMLLTPAEAHAVLTAYGIPVAETRHVKTPREAVAAAAEIGYPVALKVESPDVPRTSLAGGVALNLASDEEVMDAALSTANNVCDQVPGARMEGYAVQRMCRLAGAHELAVETATDPVFGPIIRFGQGGSMAEVLADRQTALPPLNMGLAQELVSRTRVYRLLRGSGHKAHVNLDAVRLLLCKVSQLIIDIPEIFELEIDPLFVDADGVVALDAHMRIAWSTTTGTDQLAIRPYPRELEECVALRDGRHVDLLPIRPEDEPEHWEFVESLSAEDKRFRFFGNVAKLPRAEMVKLTQIDYDREMAFIAKGPDNDGVMRTLGVVRAMVSTDNSEAEFAVAVRSDLKRQGLGKLLMQKIIRYCKARGTKRIVGAALGDNKSMAELARSVGFIVSKDYDEDIWQLDLPLEDGKGE
uniref:GCN5-related N-acetyltransferase n=1 Tax=Nitratidesulfovibrio vulgaris (strain DSM 19637 / Miyazaki F) TaxID=883 RepID=B8DM77_NITV9